MIKILHYDNNDGDGILLSFRMIVQIEFVTIRKIMLFGTTATKEKPFFAMEKSRFARRAYMYILHVLQCTYNYYKIKQGSQRAVCMWDKYNMDIVHKSLSFLKPFSTPPSHKKNDRLNKPRSVAVKPESTFR